MNAPAPLDTFESALLAELRTHVAERAPRRRPVRRWAAGLAAAAAAGAAVVVTGLGGSASVLGPTPAYAVETEPDGDVVVTIHRLQDAEGLEAALLENGIDAVVSYIDTEPGVLTVPGGRVEPGDVGGTFELHMDGDGFPCARSGDPVALSRDGGDWVVRIPAGHPAQERPIDVVTQNGDRISLTYPGDEPRTFCSAVATAR